MKAFILFITLVAFSMDLHAESIVVKRISESIISGMPVTHEKFYVEKHKITTPEEEPVLSVSEEIDLYKYVQSLDSIYNIISINICNAIDKTLRQQLVAKNVDICWFINIDINGVIVGIEFSTKKEFAELFDDEQIVSMDQSVKDVKFLPISNANKNYLYHQGRISSARISDSL
jgi:uncharacterized protein YuzE